MAHKIRCGKCGRDWRPKWISRFAYVKICKGCGRPTTACRCKPLKKKRILRPFETAK